MIVQNHDDGLLLFRQTDHALLAASFAEHWGGAFPSVEHDDSILVAAARHDDGWARWELTPNVDADGRPVDFIHVPVPEHVNLYREGVDLIESEDRLAALIASMHGERLYTRPFYPGMEPRITRLVGGDEGLAQAYVDHERERQARLYRDLAAAPGAASSGEAITEHAEEAWRLLQVWDRLSLLVCMQRIDEDTSHRFPPARTHDGDATIVAHGASEQTLRLSPFPFRRDPVRFTVAATLLPDRTWASHVAFRRALRSGRRVAVGVTCTP